MRCTATLFCIGMLAGCQAPRRPDPPPTVEQVAPQAAPTAQPAATPGTIAPEPAPPVAPAPTPPPAPGPLLGAQVFARLVGGLADPPCVQDRVVQRWERTYGRWPPRLRSNLEAILPLLALVLDELETHHLPTEFALLPIVESWYRPDAGSARTAFGMWQFTTATARHQGLRIVPGYDERLAPQAATRAAMRYLSELQNRFGDWRLANMAYNAGEYRLMRALARQPSSFDRPSAASHLPTGLSMTTYEHLAKIQALACLVAEPGRFGIELPLDTVIEPLEIVALPAGFTDLDQVARAHAVPLPELKRLNPAFLEGRIANGARRQVLLPARRAEVVAATVPEPEAPVAARRRSTTYEVVSGDTLGAIAQRLGVALADLMRWNGLELRSVIRPGQRLLLEP
jgi:membrane-bound lytic murein transglycosylase D